MSNTDLVCRTARLPRPGETIAGDSLETYAGGKGANQAVAAARASASVTFGGAVGDDTYGEQRLADLKTAGVDVSLVQTIPEIASGIAIIIVDARGQNQIVTAAGANDRVDSIELLRRLESVEYDVALMTWELNLENTRAIVRGLHPSRPVVLNAAPFDSSIHELFPDERVIVICNDVEAAGLLGREISVTEGLEAAREIQELGCRAAVVTLGESGAAGADSEHGWTVPGLAVSVVDATGAGDAFCGAFAAWVADGSNLEEATRAGVAAGSCSVGRPGAQPSLPTRDEILLLMQRTQA
ncbi:ribokinase [soil metagenome]